MFEKLFHRATQKAPENKLARESNENSVGSEGRYEVRITTKFLGGYGHYKYLASAVIIEKASGRKLFYFNERNSTEHGATQSAKNYAVGWIAEYEKKQAPPKVVKFTL